MRTRRPSTRRLAIALCLTPAALGAAAAEGLAAVPVITITSPPVDAPPYAGGGPAVASFTCTEDGIGIPCGPADINGVPVQDGGSITQALGEDLVLTVRATGALGEPESTSETRSFDVTDQTPPAAPTSVLGGSDWTNGSVSFSASGSTDSPPSSGLGYEYRTSADNGTTWSAPSSGANMTVTAEGSTFVQFRAVDGAGNFSVWVGAPGPARIDKTKPPISITSPAAQDYEYGTPLTAMYQCPPDAFSPIISCETPSGIVSGGPINTFVIANLQLTVNAADQAGNTATSVVPFTVKDTFAPGAPGILAPADGEITNNRAPTLSWSAADPAGDAPLGTSSPITGYTLKVDGQPDVNLPAGTTSFTLPPLPAPQGPLFKKRYGWEVIAKDGGNNTSLASAEFTLDLLAPPPPSVEFPPSPTNVLKSTLRFSGLPGSTFKWTVTGATGTSGGQTTSSEATIDLEEGENEIRVTQTTPAGNEGGGAMGTVVVDTVAPAPPGFLVVPPANSLAATPSLAWSGEPGARFEWELLGSTGGVLGSGATPETTIQLGPLGPGAYGFRIRQIDAAGNPGGVAGPALFSILPPPDPVAGGGSPDGATSAGGGSPAASAGTPAKPTPTPAQKIKPATSNVARLKPRAGTVVKVVRPTLRWKKHGKATLYNIQVFRMNGNRFSKVHSSFPKTNKVRLPGGRLKRGERYVWRVWPFVGRTSAKQPIGVSYFDVAPLPKTRTRLTAPKGNSVRARRTLKLRWAKSAGATRYSVVVTRGKATVYKRTTKGTRATVPKSKLRKKGSYKIRVRIVGRSGATVASSSTWAAASIRVR